MLVVDDILLFPIRGVWWCVEQVRQAAEEALADEEESIRAQLIELYMRLETGRISETAFEAEEKQLLDRMDRIEGREKPVLTE